MKSSHRVFVFAGFILLYNILGSMLLSIVFQSLPISLPPYITSTVFYLLIYLLPVWFFMHSSGITLSEIGLSKKPTTRHLLLSILLAFVIQPFLMAVSSLGAMIFHDYVEDSMAIYTQYPLVLILFSSAVLPAFCEELVCRGVFLGDLKGKSPWIAAALSGLLFGMLHMNLQQFLYAFLFGFAASWIVLGTGSLWLSILVHFLINGTQLVLAFVLTSGIPSGLLYSSGGVSLVLSCLIIYLLYKKKELV